MAGFQSLKLVHTIETLLRQDYRALLVKVALLVVSTPHGVESALSSNLE